MMSSLRLEQQNRATQTPHSVILADEFGLLDHRAEIRFAPLNSSPIEGAGLGMLGGAFVGEISFSLAFAIAIPTLDVPEGYWGFDYPKAVGMAFLAGAF